MEIHINTTGSTNSRIEQLLKLNKYSSILPEYYDINILTEEGLYSFILDEKNIIHCEFILSLIKSRIPMNITY